MKDSSGEELLTPEDVANELGSFFESTFVIEPEDNVPTLQKKCENDIPDLVIAVEEVKHLLMELNIFKSVGPDNIHPKILKGLSTNSYFVQALTELFQKCYDTGQLPSVWKKANITPLHKKGDKSQSCNYRPISLTCVLSKVFEKIVRKHMLTFIHPMIYKQQHGFLPNVSCLSNLLESMDVVYDILDECGCADILYLDFQKAFDTVPHKRLLAKLKAYGINGKMYQVLQDFLSNRTFSVKVGGKYSKVFCVTSSVPQGTVLGPLLFLIYINDLPDGIKSFLALFADDVKLITACSDITIAQCDLQKLEEWQKIWLLNYL